MANTTSNKTTILASTANTAVYTAGLALYSTPGYGKPSTVLVPTGTWVFYNPATGLSTGEAATKSTVPLLKIGVSVDLDDDGIADDIQWFNDGFNGCSMRNHAGRTPSCGLPNIRDIFFGCIECNQTYTIEVQVYDPITESFGEPGIGYIYHFTYHYPCGNCTTGDCVDSTPNADEVMCGLYNKIKGVENDPNWDITLNSIPIGGQHEYLFDVSKLYDGTAPDFADDTTFEYCLTGADSTCDNCDNYTEIGGYNLNVGGGEDVAFSPATFSGTPGSGVSKKSQIISAVSQLNEALAGNGSAVFLPAVGNCCTNNKIEVNTCLTGFELLKGDNSTITPCATSNPFSALTTYSECQDCDSANGEILTTVGLRFYSKPVQGKCDCIPGNHALVEYFSEVEVYFKRGWNTNGGVRSVVRQQGTLPKGQGFQWQSRQIRHMQDGFQEPFFEDLKVGKYGLFADNSRLGRVTINCKDNYCVMGGTYQGKTRHDNMGETSFVPQDVYALIPNDHSTAKTSFLAAWNAYFAGGDCGIAALTCASY